MDWPAKQILISQAERHSPCIGVCKLDEDTGLCIGCARTADEIAQWLSLDASARFAIWEQLPQRHFRQAKRARLMPLTPQEILTWAAATIENRLGTWTVGVPGTLAEFIAAPDQTTNVNLQSDQLIGRTGTASFRLRGHEKLRAFAFEEGSPIVLGLPKARIDRHSNSVVTKLGADADVVLPDCRHHLLFDFGLGREFSRFCIRTANEALISVLEGFEGNPWQALMAAASSHIVSESPHRVVESALVRIEVYAPIPRPNECSPGGAHTHFLPAFLMAGEEISPSLALPDYAAPIAIFYPTQMTGIWG